MKSILFFYPSNNRSNVIETTLKALRDLDYKIFFLTSCKKGALHEALEKEGIQVFANSTPNKKGIPYYISQIRNLIRFCNHQKIDILFSNLQHANFIAVFAQFFIKARLVAFRHHFKFSKPHFDVDLTINANEKRFDWVINRLAKEIAVPAISIKRNIVKYEGVKPEKLKVLPYLYDFSRFTLPKQEEVEKIRNQYKAKLLLVMVSRLIPFKRHMLVLPIIHKLIDEGHDIKLIILDEGPEKQKIKDYIQKHQIEESILLLGFQANPLQYIAASDLLIHPSLTEASNNVVKECGLLKKAVAVCNGVGDFEEYIEDKKNGFLVDIERPSPQFEEIIKSGYSNPERLTEMGIKLRTTILEKFSGNKQQIEIYKDLILE
jgi:glycosyltransferase involved in cell wall biosynthesis